MNKDIGALVRDHRLRFAPAISPDGLGAGPEGGQGRHGRRPPYLDAVRRRAAFIGAVALAGTAVVGVVALVVPPTYTATAQLIVEPTASEVAAALLGPVIDTHITMLTSDSRLRRVLAERSGDAAHSSRPATPTLDERLRGVLIAAAAAGKNIVFPARPEADPPGPGAAVQDMMALKESLLVRQERQSSIVSVSARGKDPEVAAATASRLVTLHVDELRERKRRDADLVRSNQDGRVEGVRAELRHAEEDLKAFQAANGTVGPDDSTDLIAEVKRQLASAQASLRAREAQLKWLGTSPPSSEGGMGAADGRARERAEVEHEVRDLGFRADKLEARLAELQTKSTLAFRQQVEQQALELRITSLRKLLDDLMLRRQEDPKDAVRPFAAEARVFALASVPSRPSSINPLITLPPAFFAFGVLGIALALWRERRNHVPRSEHEVEAAAGIPCLGLAPARPSRRAWRHAEQAARRELAFRSLAQGLSQLCDSGHGMQTVLVTSSRREADKGDLTVGLAAGLARAGSRVLVVDGIDWGSAPPSDPASAQPDPGSVMGLPVVQDAERRIDRLTLGGACDDVLVDRFFAFHDSLTGRYDYVLLDAPPLLTAPQTRLLAAKVDGVIVGLAWGMTQSAVILEARQALYRTAKLAGRFDVSCVAVLTNVDRRTYAHARSA